MRQSIERTYPRRRHWAGLLLAAIWLSAVTPRAGAAQEADTSWVPKVEVTLLGGSVYHLRVMDEPQGAVNLVASVGPDGLLLVDYPGNWQTMSPPEATVVAKIDEALAALGAARPRMLVNSHWHGDHTGGNALFGDEALVIAHANTRRRLAERQTPFWQPEGLGPVAPSARPVITFTDSLSIHFNGDTVHLLHFGPAHTDGDAVVYFREAKVVHMGDLYHGLNGLAVGSDMDGLARVLGAVASRVPPDARIVTGHAGVTDRAELADYHRLLVETLAHVRRQVRDGRSLEEIQQAGLPGTWAQRLTVSEAGIARWLENVYRTVQGTTGEDRP